MMGSPNATGYNGRVWLYFMGSIYTDVYMVYRMSGHIVEGLG